MFAVVVDLRIKPGRLSEFLPLMQVNAAASLREEPGCIQFDVVQVAGDPDLILLYETYESAAAFDVHLKTAHFLEFDAAVADMVAEKIVRTGAVL